MDTPNPAETSNTSALPPIRQLFTESWNALVQSILNLLVINIFGILGYIVLIVLVVALGFILGLSSVLSGDFSALSTGFQAPLIIAAVVLGLIFLILFIAISVAVEAASIIVISNYKEKPSAIAAFKAGFYLVLPLLGMTLIGLLFGIGGFFAFFIPILIFAILFIFTSYEIVLNNKSGLEAFRRSMYLVTNNFGEIFIRSLIIIVLYFIAVVLVPEIIIAINETIGNIVNALISVLTFFIGWFILAFYTVLYKQISAASNPNGVSSLRWPILIAAIGWIIAIGILLVIKQLASSADVAKNLFDQKNQSSLELFESEATSSDTLKLYD